MKRKVPKPGSEKAIQAGCDCRVSDNNYGEGILKYGKKHYLVNEKCKLHGLEEEDGK